MVCVHSCVSELGDCGLWVGHCRVGARAIPCVPSCVVVLCDVGATRTYCVHCWYSDDAAGKTDVERGVMWTAVKQNE